ncbi:hypothetical protein C4K88_14785 [Arthrobacter pityocampae]|uniref:Uncharacterized protein n=1 Tax=Arthrobacter pityocampae TaxID=547334 RepID=A0A2S5IUJ4_9MICC|nr:hypothetical protein [Arthrobacter pityocampae]PPB48228.1 hypothetical protein C4K88_14785 [Arthrobacter pityocampae]
MTGRETPPDAVLHLLDEAGIAEDPALVRAVKTIGALGAGPAPEVTAELAQLMAAGGKAPPARRNKRRITFIGGALAVSMGVGMSGVAAGTFHLTDGLTEAVESIARFTIRDSADRAQPLPGAMAGPDDGGRGVVTPAEIPAPSHATAVPAPSRSVTEPSTVPSPSVADPSRPAPSVAVGRAADAPPSAAGARPSAVEAGPSAAPATRRPVHTAPRAPGDTVQRADPPPAVVPPAAVPARQAPPVADPVAGPAAAPHAVPRAAASPVAPAGSAPAPGRERRSAPAPHSPAPESRAPESRAPESPAPGSHTPGAPVPGSGKAPHSPASGNGKADKSGHEVRQMRQPGQEQSGGLDAGSQGAGASPAENTPAAPGRAWLLAPAGDPGSIPSAPEDPDRPASGDPGAGASTSMPAPTAETRGAEEQAPAPAPENPEAEEQAPVPAPAPAAGPAGASGLR